MATIDALVPSSKRQKTLEPEDVSHGGEDRISKLPDDLLLDILFFLPTKEAIKTSILSSRWKNLWVALPDLYFLDYSIFQENQDCVPESRSSFLKLVDRSLHTRNVSIRRLSLTSHKKFDPIRLKSWLSAAIMHQVEELDLALDEQEYVIFPDGFFTSESLIRLNLKMNCILEIPSPICFSNLKILYLSNVKFKDEQTYLKLLSGCRVLEELELYECNWKNLKEFYIDIPTPFKLVLSNYFTPLFEQENYSVNCALMIETSNQLAPYHTAFVLYSVLVDIHCSSPRPEVEDHRAATSLSQLPRVFSLCVTNNTLEALSFAENPEAYLPTFRYLTSLDVIPDHTGAVTRTIGALMHLLEKAPYLEALSILKGFEPDEQEWFFETLPRFNSCLKSFCISYFEGTEADVHLLKYLCQNAPVLKEITLYCANDLISDLKKLEDIMSQLLQVLGDSTSCAIEFYRVS